MGMVQITEGSLPSERLDTEYGEKSVEEWLELEKKRIERNPNRTTVIHKEGRMIALWANDVLSRKKKEVRNVRTLEELNAIIRG